MLLEASQYLPFLCTTHTLIGLLKLGHQAAYTPLNTSDTLLFVPWGPTEWLGFSTGAPVKPNGVDQHKQTAKDVTKFLCSPITNYCTVPLQQF